MEDPVIAADGHTYERASIQEWLELEAKRAAAEGRPPAPRSPMTNEPLAHSQLTPNHALRAAIAEARSRGGL
eukprot:scaffold3.g6663.t1